jgi:hypothetical protein
MSTSAKTTVFGWHFAANDMRLGYGDGRKIRDGETLKYIGELKLCRRGLHFSEDVFDALKYARGHMICRIEGPADALNGGDKRCARWRKCLWHIDGEKLLREFAHWCSNWPSTITLGPNWETTMCAARAAYYFAEAAAWDSAWIAAYEAYKAEGEASWETARKASMKADRSVQRDKLLEMIEEARK